MTDNLSFDAEQRELQGAWFTENLAPNHGYAGVAYRVPPASRVLNLAPAGAVRNDLSSVWSIVVGVVIIKRFAVRTGTC
jgi:hypothetical protein